MVVLERLAGPLAVAGGASITVIVATLAIQPAASLATPAWYALLVGIGLLGAAVPGMYRRTGRATGRLGLASAWLSGVGAIGTVGAVAYFVGTGQIAAAQQALPDGPAGAVAMGASFAWLAGNLGFAVAVARTRALPRAGALMVLAGALLPLALAPVTSNAASSALAQLGTAAFLLLPAGWIVLGIGVPRSVSSIRPAGA